MRRRCARTKMPKKVKREAKKQIDRLEHMHPEASEATIVRTYIDWILGCALEKIIHRPVGS